MPRSPQKPMVVVITGEKLAGKEVAAQYFVRHYGFKHYNSSDILSNILRLLHLPISRVNHMNLVGSLRERFGGGVLAETVKKQIQEHKEKRAIFAGLRHPVEYDVLSKMPGFLLVYITAPLPVRFARAKARKEKAGESKFTLSDFKREEKLVTELFIQKLGKKAKVKLVNDGSLKDLYKQIEEKIVKNYL